MMKHICHFNIFVCLFALLLSNSAFATTWKVGADESVKIAIRNAAAGDTILLGPGDYQGNVIVDKSLTIKGAGTGRTRWEFILNEKKGEEEKEPGGIKIVGKDIELKIEELHMHLIEGLNTINVSKDAKKSAAIYIANCKFTSEEDSWPVIYTRGAGVKIERSLFEGVKGTSIMAESGSKLTINDSRFVAGGGDYGQVYVDKSEAVIEGCKFTNINGTCVIVDGGREATTFNGSQFSGCGKRGYPSLWIIGKAKTNAVDCQFTNLKGSAVVVEGGAQLGLKGENSFSGSQKMKEPVIVISNGTVRVDGGSGSKTPFADIERCGIKVERGGEFIAEDCQFQGNPNKVVFIDCTGGKMSVKRSEFGDNKGSVHLQESRGFVMEDCRFGKSSSCSIKIKKAKGKGGNIIQRCIFDGANGNCVKVEANSSVQIDECDFSVKSIKNPCLDIDKNSRVTITGSSFKDAGVICIRVKGKSNIEIKGCEFYGGINGEHYAIRIENKSRADIIDSRFEWQNNRYFFAKDCAEIRYWGMK